MGKWSVCSPSIPTIGVQILLESTVFILKNCLKGRTCTQKEAVDVLFKNKCSEEKYFDFKAKIWTMNFVSSKQNFSLKINIIGILFI